MLTILAGNAPRSLSDALSARGEEVLKLPPHPELPLPVSHHPDLLLFFARDAILCTERYAAVAQRELELIARRAEKPIRTIPETCGGIYPADILLCAAAVGEYLLCRPDATAKAILEDSGRTVVPVRQGYAKCSTVPIGDRAIITSDPSIARAARNVGLSVCMTEPTGISLPGYDHGLIGGCASFSPYRDRREIYICGDLAQLSNKEQIEAFCRAHGHELIGLCPALPLTDVGTIFLI